MLQQKPITTHQLVCFCDRCGREMQSESHDGEWEERLAITFWGGYNSIFGDGNLVECDLCQQCVKDMLEKYLRITHDDPFDPKYKPQAEHYRAYQHYQLRDEVQLSGLREEMEGMFRGFSKRLRQKEDRERVAEMDAAQEQIENQQ